MITAHTQPNWMSDTLDIWILKTTPHDERELLRIHNDPNTLDQFTWEPGTPGTNLPDPTIRLRFDHARALLDALTAHFHGTSDTRQLRNDYDAERARVDRLIAILAPQGPA